MPGRHSGDQVHKVKKTAAPSFFIFYAQSQRTNVAGAADALAQIIRAGHKLVITHGNGPQIEEFRCYWGVWGC